VRPRVPTRGLVRPAKQGRAMPASRPNDPFGARAVVATPVETVYTDLSHRK